MDEQPSPRELPLAPITVFRAIMMGPKGRFPRAAVAAAAGAGHGQSETHNRATIRFIASSTFSRLLNALNRAYPSPAAPNPLPGVQTTLACSSIASKNCQLETPLGVCTQTYGALMPPNTFMPALASFSRMILALV